MAPQAPSLSSASAPTVQLSASPSASSSPSPKPFVPTTLFIFLGICLAYTISYLFYRFVMARRLRSEEVPDTPDRGVATFMNGYRLTLNLGNLRPSPPGETETPNTAFDEAKPATVTDPPELTTSPGLSSPFIILTPSFTVHSVHSGAELERFQTRVQPPLQEQDTGQSQPLVPAPAPPSAHAQPSFTQRVAAKVKFLSRDRVEAIALDPKLAPVQGPLRPLSMEPSPPRKQRTTRLFGLGLKHVGEADQAKDSDAR